MALQRGVVIEAGDVCLLGSNPPRHYFKLGFSAIKLEAIEPGIRVLAEIIGQL